MSDYSHDGELTSLGRILVEEQIPLNVNSQTPIFHGTESEVANGHVIYQELAEFKYLRQYLERVNLKELPSYRISGTDR